MTTTSRAGSAIFTPEPAGDLVAHAGEAVLQVVAAGLLGAPELVRARPAARRRRRPPPRRRSPGARPRRSPGHRRAGRCRPGARSRRPSRGSRPRRPRAPPSARRPARASRPASRASASSAAPASPTTASAPCLAASNAATLIWARRTPGRAKSAREPVVKSEQARADADHEVGLGGGAVRRARAGDPDRAQRQRMVPGERALAGLASRRPECPPPRRTPPATASAPE